MCVSACVSAHTKDFLITKKCILCYDFSITFVHYQRNRKPKSPRATENLNPLLKWANFHALCFVSACRALKEILNIMKRARDWKWESEREKKKTDPKWNWKNLFKTKLYLTKSSEIRNILRVWHFAILLLLFTVPCYMNFFVSCSFAFCVAFCVAICVN